MLESLGFTSRYLEGVVARVRGLGLLRGVRQEEQELEEEMFEGFKEPLGQAIRCAGSLD